MEERHVPPLFFSRYDRLHGVHDGGCGRVKIHEIFLLVLSHRSSSAIVQFLLFLSQLSAVKTGNVHLHNLPFFAPFSTLFRQFFLDFFPILLFLFLASSRFFIISSLQLLTSLAMSTMTICVRANTFSKKNIEYDPCVPSNPDFGTSSFRHFFYLCF